MDTLGSILRQARIAKRLSWEALEKKTKIKKSFLVALEKQNWQALPEYPVVLGFVKNVASALSISENKALALLRRDYPPKTLSINPKPDVENKFLWSPRLTFLAGFFVLALIFISYLGFQYVEFIRPPHLEVSSPIENEEIEMSPLEVKGKTDPEASVEINNQPVLVEDSGEFSGELEIAPETKEISVIAKSRSGKQTIINRKIVPKLK